MLYIGFALWGIIVGILLVGMVWEQWIHEPIRRTLFGGHLLRPHPVPVLIVLLLAFVAGMGLLARAVITKEAAIPSVTDITRVQPAWAERDSDENVQWVVLINTGPMHSGNVLYQPGETCLVRRRYAVADPDHRRAIAQYAPPYTPYGSECPAGALWHEVTQQP